MNDWPKAPLPKPAPVESYPIHADGGIIYDPLRREAERTGQLAAYKDAPAETATLEIPGARLEFQVPRKAKAYDVIPIPYTLHIDPGTEFPVAVEAAAFEEETKRNSRNLFDLALPGRIDFDVDFIGSVTAHLVPEKKHNITPDFSDTPQTYPNFVRQPLVRSGIVEAGDLVWFQFRLKNTGNTIFDAEGFGGGQLYPELLRKDKDGIYQPFAKTYNLYYRNLTYWYPGETWEPWILFSIPKEGMPKEHYRLEPGDYKIRLRMTCRLYQTPDPAINYWDGPEVFSWEQPITVEAAPAQAPVAAGSKLKPASDLPNKLPTFIHTFEEFMTAFDCHLKPPQDRTKSIQGTLYLQVAPWTRQVVLRLIGGKVPEVVTKAVPIQVDAGSLKLNLPEKLPHVVAGADGKAQPLFFSQTMADMRTGVQVGPWPEKHIRSGIREMKDLGVNFVATTSMPWLYDDSLKRPFNHAGDALKYALEVLRQEGMPVEAWAQYPFDRGTIRDISTWISGRDFSGMGTVPSGYGDGSQYISMLDDRLSEANAATLLYHLARWGDLFFQEQDGTVPIGVEDTRGWMRDDLNVRFPVGPQGTAAFRQWLEHRYASIEKLNQAWKTSFESFDQIDPETYKLGKYGQRWSYGDASHPFHDWNQAVEDFDIWRTIVRVGNYRDYLGIAKERIPDPKVMFRTEGGQAIVGGLDPEGPNAHFRHAYYGQRRLGAIAEILSASGVVGYHADYTTLPYTPTELRKIVKLAVSQGITPAYLPQFNQMRDIAINPQYGNPYQTDYNLNTPMKGYMMHVLTASYPWYQVMIEEGGIPGILWEDLECSGFATDTQKREMRLYQEKLNRALEALPPESRIYQPPTNSWRPKGMRSYVLPPQSTAEGPTAKPASLNQ